MPPITKKKNGNGKNNGIRYGVASMQGWRKTMEDAHCVSLKLPGERNNWSFAGVYDGHAGGKTSAYVSKHLLQTILRNIPTEKETDSKQDQENLETGIFEGFISLDNAMRNSKKINDNSGTTAVCVFITQTHFVFANCGDSRAVLCRDDHVAFATTDHKPTKKTEKQRILGAGGQVRKDRLVLDVSGLVTFKILHRM